MIGKDQITAKERLKSIRFHKEEIGSVILLLVTLILLFFI